MFCAGVFFLRLEHGSSAPGAWAEMHEIHFLFQRHLAEGGEECIDAGR